ncbi:MAG: GAF domain-containing protein [Anaerolineae bacterium]|nr:GAF domain-containing protein [Anaerolineae bacterium]
MSVTQPSPPNWRRPPSLRMRSRTSMALGLNLVVILIAGCASLILVLEQWQFTLKLHESTTSQARASVLNSITTAEHVLTTAARSVDAETSTEAGLKPLLDDHPALLALSVIAADGSETATVTADNAGNLLDTRQPPVLQDELDGQRQTDLSPHDQASPTFMMAVPAGQGGSLVAWLDTQILWQNAVSADMGDRGYAFLLDRDGLLLAYGARLAPAVAEGDITDTPAALPSVKAASRHDPALKLYAGVDGSWVVGRAESIPNTNLIVVTETPLREYNSLVIRGLALWGLALAVTALTGELLIRRILKNLTAPLSSFVEATRAVGAGDYAYRVRVPDGVDRELVDLGRGFNIMIVRLQNSQQQIDRYTHEVEEIVDLRARELSRKAMQLEVAAEISRTIATIMDPDALIDEVVRLILEQFKIYHVEILRVDAETGDIWPGGERAVEAQTPLNVRDAAPSIVAWVARNNKTFYVPDVHNEPRFRPDPDLPATQSELAIPLTFGGMVMGVLNLEADHRNAFAPDDVAVLESLANEVAVSIHNAQVFNALQTANRDLAQATLQAKQANILKSRFLLNASHKLRTPLNAIIGYSETILSGIYGDIPGTATDRQRRILENGRHLQALIEDMLDLSSIESGHMELNLEWIELAPLLDEVMNASHALHQTAYADHDLALRLEMAGNLPPVWADVQRLRYILINLMDNAVKFSERGNVVMSTATEDDHINICVSDTGPGIDQDVLDVLFEPFQQEHGSTSSAGRGAGLGLPVSHLLAIMHGGDLVVDSVPKQGCTFTLRLPCHPDGAPPVPDFDAMD